MILPIISVCGGKKKKNCNHCCYLSLNGYHIYWIRMWFILYAVSLLTCFCFYGWRRTCVNKDKEQSTSDKWTKNTRNYNLFYRLKRRKLVITWNYMSLVEGELKKCRFSGQRLLVFNRLNDAARGGGITFRFFRSNV